MRDRPTADLIMVFLAGVTGATIFLCVLAILFLEVTKPSVNTTALASRLAGMVNSLIGAIVGYVAGRGTSRNEGDKD